MPETLQKQRHSLAHLLAMAALRFDPEAQLAIGPAIDSGFYYDIRFSEGKMPSPEDLKTFEQSMKSLARQRLSFDRLEVTPQEAKARFAGNPFKLELIDELEAAGETISLYQTGDFVDLCRGGHIENTQDVDPESFALTRIAGAYWRGDEKNPMLTRIYGAAFETKAALEAYFAQQAEAEKRDHRKLGEELGLFTFDEAIGPGLPLWLPNGTTIIEELETLAKETEREAGYDRVRTPHIAKESLYLTSGHLPYYQDSMFPPMEYEGGKYYLKAMNCPHHHKIFAARPKSYRDLPLRLAEYGTVYRHEKSGELFGLMRVRMMQMNDAHIYCTQEQFADEFRRVNEMYLRYFDIFGIQKYVMRLSLHDPAKLGEKYVNEPMLWQETEAMVRDVLAASKIPFVEVPDEAAFYGPKIDVQVWSVIGREFTLATNQVDFAVPRRFGLEYVTSAGTKATPLCIHRAPLGTHERFIGFLIEHYAGAFPLWLAPIQIAVLPVTEAHNTYAQKIRDALGKQHFRVKLYNENETLGKKIRAAKTFKSPYLIVVGREESASNTLTLESRDRGKIGVLSLEEALVLLTQERDSRQ